MPSLRLNTLDRFVFPKPLLTIAAVIFSSIVGYFTWPQSAAEKTYRRSCLLKEYRHSPNPSWIIPLYGRDRYLTCDPYVYVAHIKDKPVICEPYAYLTKIGSNAIVFFPDWRGREANVSGTFLCTKPLDKTSIDIDPWGKEEIWLNLPEGTWPDFYQRRKCPVEITRRVSSTEFEGCYGLD